MDLVGWKLNGFDRKMLAIGGVGVIGYSCHGNISDYKRDVGNFSRVEKEAVLKYVEGVLL